MDGIGVLQTGKRALQAEETVCAKAGDQKRQGISRTIWLQHKCKWGMGRRREGPEYHTKFERHS